MDILAVEQVSKRFGGLQALDGCSFSVAEGVITCLIGPNGAGKTTVFNVITGFLRPDGGSIRFRAQRLDGLAPHEVTRLGVARSFQHLRLFREMTVLQNVLLALPNQDGELVWDALLFPWRVRKHHRVMREEARELLEVVGLTPQADTVAASLSYGEQKLLSITRVLATRADVLLLDEPASGLDQETMHRMIQLLRKLCGLGKTLLVVEHNVGLVRDIADYVLFLHQGKLVGQGAPEEVIADRYLTEIYFGGIAGRLAS